jgi:hypothetical protein
MSPADAVFSHCRFVWLSQTNVPVVLLDPGINRTASLPNVNLTTLARYAVDTRSFQSQVILHRPKKISNILWWKAYRLDVMPGQHTTNVIEGRANKRKKGNRSGLLRSSLMMEAVRTSETSVDNNFTRQYIPEDNSEYHTRHRENLKSHNL